MRKFISTLLVAFIIVCTMVPIKVNAAFNDVIEDPTVYETVEDLYSACRAVFRDHKVGTYEFHMTDEVWSQITRWDDLYNQSFFTGNIFDFYGDQSSIPPAERDYITWNLAGFASYGSVSDYDKTIQVAASDNFFTTIEQEKTFEKDLKALFAAGGPLEKLKSASDYEKVVGCMDYIKQNVSYIGTVQGVYHSAYSALSGEKKATCQGYALLLNRMLLELGISNRILMYETTGAHTFNIVLLDGKYYFCDATSYTILKGSNNFSCGSLNESFRDEKFQTNIMSKISPTDYPIPHTHSFSNQYTTDSTNHWYACSCGEVKDKTVHTAGEWVTIKEATYEADGERAKACSKCGYKMETQKLNKLEKKEYEILDNGKNTTYETKGETVSIRAAGEIEKFVSVYVDGSIVDKKYYTVKEGSTIISFTEEYLNTLSVGKHTVVMNFTDGVAQANLTVSETVKKPTETQPTDESEKGTTVETQAEDEKEITGENQTKDEIQSTEESKTTGETDTTSTDNSPKDDDLGIIGWIIGGVSAVVIIAGVSIFIIRKNKASK